MDPVVYIVARERPDLYDFLDRHFAGEEGVRIVTDRRQGERRQRDTSHPGDQRRADRRAQRYLDEQISSLGWAVVR